MNRTEDNPELTYRAAGVDIDAGNKLVDRIKPIAKATHNANVLTGLGGFAALYALPEHNGQRPTLVASTDGVGTKLKLALQLDQHDGIGIDLVAMCVNDIVVCGAKPLFFLDYYATGKLDVGVAEKVIAGIGAGCEQANMALIGGETAELPGMYHGDDYDLAGFCVGMVDQQHLIDGQAVTAGDTLIGIASSGPHANGYSLIRKIIDDHDIDLQSNIAGKPLATQLMAPTRIYVRSILNLLEHCPIHAMAHITGGGFLENIPRVLPQQCAATINTNAWQRPAIFNWLQQHGNIKSQEMYRTFNCGIGMVICVPETHATQALAVLQESGEQAWIIGSVTQRDSADAAQVIINEL